MKKLVFGFGLTVAIAAGFTACEKTETCYTCTHTSSSCTVDVCNGTATGDSTSTCTNLAATSNAQGYTTNLDHKNYLEQVGFTCTEK